MNQDKDTKKRGGKRQGAGKKATCGKPILFKPDLDLEEFIRAQKNVNRFINETIRERLERSKNI
ncbi:MULTISPECIES: hypothetical protein [Butyricimonas]|uniref:hypothetical protein n=1 Tax=Butyricimonas TaxID=574697 RepID=UPI0007FB42ED|nr:MULTISPECIES: hypothetical protein [Butyricimonas]